VLFTFVAPVTEVEVRSAGFVHWSAVVRMAGSLS
jgi:hypothetical protein